MVELGEPTRLKSQYPSKHPFVQWFIRKYCSWGNRRLDYYGDGQLGSPAPLWKNNSADFYKVFFILNLISSLIFIIFFLVVKVYNAGQQQSVTATSSTNSTAANVTIPVVDTNNIIPLTNNTVSNGTYTNDTVSNGTATNGTAANTNGTVSNGTNTNDTASIVSNATITNGTSVANRTVIIITNTTTHSRMLVNTTTVISTNNTVAEATCMSEVANQLKSYFIMIGSCILLVNASMARFISKITYASDQEWFRYLVLNFICCSILSVFNFFEYLDFLQSLKFLNLTLKTSYPTAARCIIFFQFNLYSNFINTVAISTVCVIQIFMIFYNFNYFFIQRRDITARYDDKDIAVYT